MKKYYVSFDSAKLLKEKGFNESRIGSVYKITEHGYIPSDNKRINKKIDNFILRPELHQVQQWLRDNCKMHIIIKLYCENDKFTYTCLCHSFKTTEKGGRWHGGESGFDSYEEALSAGIDYALTLI